MFFLSLKNWESQSNAKQTLVSNLDINQGNTQIEKLIFREKTIGCNGIDEDQKENWPWKCQVNHFKTNEQSML